MHIISCDQVVYNMHDAISAHVISGDAQNIYIYTDKQTRKM